MVSYGSIYWVFKVGCDIGKSFVTKDGIRDGSIAISGINNMAGDKLYYGYTG